MNNNIVEKHQVVIQWFQKAITCIAGNITTEDRESSAEVFCKCLTTNVMRWDMTSNCLRTAEQHRRLYCHNTCKNSSTDFMPIKEHS